MTRRPPEAVLDAVLDTVFPSTAPRSRRALGVSLAGVTVLLLGLSLMRWQAPLIGLVGLGLPLLFALHVWNEGMLRGDALVVAALGAVLGIGWAIGNDAAVTSTGPDALGTPVSTARALTVGLVLPLTFLALLVLLGVAARLVLRGSRNPLRGSLIGALGAYLLTAASTLTSLASSFDDGLLADDNRAAGGLVVAAMVQGLAIPLTAAGIGGAIGATLCRAQPAGATRVRLGSPTAAIGGGVLAFLALGLLDLSRWPYGVQAVIYSAIAVLALCLRRRVRREVPPSVVAGRSPSRTVVLAGVGAMLVMAVSAALSLWVTPPAARYVCPPNCGRPPLRQPVATNPRFTPAGGQFSVSYPGAGTAYTTEFEPSGVALTLLAGEGGTLRLYGEPATGRTARQVVEDVLADAHPDARVDYEIPNALVGYRLGYGVVADVYAADSIGEDSRLRVLVMASVKDDYALIAAGAGRFREFTPEFGSGHPSGANFLLALDMGKYVNSFTWQGDPPR